MRFQYVLLLYAQQGDTLFIQRGKNGKVGISYPKDTYTEINGDQYIITNPRNNMFLTFHGKKCMWTGNIKHG